MSFVFKILNSILVLFLTIVLNLKMKGVPPEVYFSSCKYHLSSYIKLHESKWKEKNTSIKYYI